MSSLSVPVEIMIRILELMDETEAEQPHDVEKHREMCRTLMAVRLTCKNLESIATRQLFRTFCFSASPDSWSKLGKIAINPKVGVHLQILALDIRNHYNISYEMMVRSPFDYNGPPPFDLSLIRSLRVVKAGTEWVLSKKKRSSIQIPLGRCTINPYSFSGNIPAVWSVLDSLADMTRYDFTLTSLSCKLGEDHWPSLSRVDFSGLRSLKLHFDGSYSDDDDLEADIDLIARLQDLPNLESFQLDQFFHDRSDASWWRLEFMTNVIQQFATKKWPKLRHLDLRYLATTVEDLKAFLLPHARMLETFDLYSDLVCMDVTAEEEVERIFLPVWVRTVICRKEGGETAFNHFWDEPDGNYETGIWEDSVEEELSDEEWDSLFNEAPSSEIDEDANADPGLEEAEGEYNIENSDGGDAGHEDFEGGRESSMLWTGALGMIIYERDEPSEEYQPSEEVQ